MTTSIITSCETLVQQNLFRIQGFKTITVRFAFYRIHPSPYLQIIHAWFCVYNILFNQICTLSAFPRWFSNLLHRKRMSTFTFVLPIISNSSYRAWCAWSLWTACNFSFDFLQYLAVKKNKSNHWPTLLFFYFVD